MDKPINKKQGKHHGEREKGSIYMYMYDRKRKRTIIKMIGKIHMIAYKEPADYGNLIILIESLSLTSPNNIDWRTIISQ